MAGPFRIAWPSSPAAAAASTRIGRRVRRARRPPRPADIIPTRWRRGALRGRGTDVLEVRTNVASSSVRALADAAVARFGPST
jgi:hypothetical protein